MLALYFCIILTDEQVGMSEKITDQSCLCAIQQYCIHLSLTFEDIKGHVVANLRREAQMYTWVLHEFMQQISQTF